MSAESVRYKADWRVRTKKKALQILGGHCVRCGITEKLQFDHVVPGSQEFRIAEALSNCYSWERILAELAKCQLLCGPCHQAKSREAGETGGGWNRIDEHGYEAYCIRTGCRCEPCQRARREARLKRLGKDCTPQRPYRVDHGGGVRGKRGCKCELCRLKYNEYMRELRKRDR